MQTIRYEEVTVLTKLHQRLFKKMRDMSGATIASTLDMPDPETKEHVDIVEDEGTYRIQSRMDPQLSLAARWTVSISPWGSIPPGYPRPIRFRNSGSSKMRRVSTDTTCLKKPSTDLTIISKIHRRYIWPRVSRCPGGDDTE